MVRDSAIVRWVGVGACFLAAACGPTEFGVCVGWSHIIDQYIASCAPVVPIEPYECESQLVGACSEADLRRLQQELDCHVDVVSCSFDERVLDCVAVLPELSDTCDRARGRAWFGQ